MRMASDARMLNLVFCLHGGCSSGVERRIVDPDVAGSRPVTHPNSSQVVPHVPNPQRSLVHNLVVPNLIEAFDVRDVQSPHRVER